MPAYNRRDFLKTSLMGGMAAVCLNPLERFASIVAPDQYSASVSLTTGDNRADLVFRALKPYSDQIAKAIGRRPVILKPNNVSIDKPLCATHADTLEGILEFLKSIRKADNAVIAESAAGGPALEGFSNYGYNRLAAKYGIKMIDLDYEPYDVLYVFDEKDFRPHPIRMSHLLLDPDSYIVSVARMKTHDRVVATLSLKNIVFGAPIKGPGEPGSKRRKNDKPIAHGSGFRGANYNLYALSGQLHPDLAIIDGFEGMEGNGPNNGTPVDHRVCVAGMDWLAADRVAIELMGIDFAKVGYLNYCAQAGKGIADLSKIKIIGEPIGNHKKSYRLADNFEKQLVWMNPV
jgi:uncharacterized protein (DUF362 family)